jgi:hypothetical protein
MNRVKKNTPVINAVTERKYSLQENFRNCEILKSGTDK